MFSLLQSVVKMNGSPTPKLGKACIPPSVNAFFTSTKSLLISLFYRNFSAFLIPFSLFVNAEYWGIKVRKYPANPRNVATSLPLLGTSQSLIRCKYSGIIQTPPLLISCPKYSTLDWNNFVLQDCILIPAATCARTTWTKCPKCGQGSPVKVSISLFRDPEIAMI